MSNARLLALGGLALAAFAAPALVLSGDPLAGAGGFSGLRHPALRIALAGAAIAGPLFFIWLAHKLYPEDDPTSHLHAPYRGSPASAEIKRLSSRAKKRVTRIRIHIRRTLPELLPEVATYEAMLNRLLQALASHPEGLSLARRHLDGELAALEKAGEKLSVVLGERAEDDAAGRFRFALVQMTGEAASCLAGLRSMGTHVTRPEPRLLGGAPTQRV